MTGQQLREAFVRFFQKHGHTAVPSAPLVPRDDPTLLFTNAGMVQFKGVFLGEEARPYTRAVSVQKCLRAGGKHNDLENVGRTQRHHTFFEMLGNFSFGDYFKREAIAFAWEFLVKELGLDPARLWVTVYQEDEEAHRLWREVTPIPAERIVRFGMEDNFWSMGETGPCGPCSEVHYDQGPQVSGDPFPNGRGDRVMEIWNLVFMQYDRDASGRLSPLPRPSIDTGMGLERLAAVMQGVAGNFETDLFRPLLDAVGKRAGKAYHEDARADVSFRVIADHVRAVTFLVAEGLLPSNEGRGYVLRRIIRRAARHGRLLGLEGPFLHELVPVVVATMGEAYPELAEAEAYVRRVTEAEEERFRHALEAGLREMDAVIARVRARSQRRIPGQDLFRLYDTFGFPLDIAQEVAEEAGLGLDLEGYRQAMEAQRNRARASWAGSGAERVAPVYRKLAETHPETRFLGYETLEADGRILAILKDGELVEGAREGEDVEVLVDQTPFYGEAGGQVGDRGWIHGPGGRLHVETAVKPVETHVLHRGRVKQGTLSPGDAVHLRVDREARQGAACNHTATHLLHAALRAVLGDHVKQAGSLVAPDRLRFDYTHFAPLAEPELDRIEALVNAQVRRDSPVETRVMGLDEALQAGAVALFGERYGERVRVVRIADFSTELCGGTHLRHTGEIGLFKIVHEQGVAAGVRRIEAVTGEAAYRRIKAMEEDLRAAAAALKSRDLRLAPRVEKLLAAQRELERELERLRSQLSARQAQDLLQEARDVQGVRVLVKRLDGASAEELRELGDRLRDRMGSGIIVLGSAAKGKVSFVAMVTRDLTPRFHAGELVREIAALTGGSGGGRPEMAQAGGKHPERLDDALAQVFERVAEKSAESGKTRVDV